MNVKLLKGYVLAFVSLVVLTAAAFLVLNNIGGKPWELWVFWKPVSQRPAAWLVMAGLGGVVVYLTVRRLLPKAIADLREGTGIRRAKATARHVSQIEKNQKGRPR